MSLASEAVQEVFDAPKTLQRPTPLPSPITNEDRAAHRAFVETLGDKAIWRQYV
jgi:DNA polymerase-3 subunit epsilon